MAIQIVIRPASEEHEVAFLAGDLRQFTAARVRIGRDPGCECALSAPDLPEEAAVLTFRPLDGAWMARPASGVEVLLNQAPLPETGAELHSGDELRCGDWKFRFHKDSRPVGYARSADALSLLAKVLIALILIVEIGMVAWLPRVVDSARMWEKQAARQRVAQTLDLLRDRNTQAKPHSPSEVAARKFFGDRLNALARYLRYYSDTLSRDQVRAVSEDLKTYADVLRLLNDGTPFRETTPLDADAAVKAVLAK